MSHPSSPRKIIGSPAISRGATWVQTDRAAHEVWGRLAVRKPRASAVLHFLVSKMGQQNAVVISQGALAKLTGCSLATLKRAIADLKAERWIDVRRIGPTGTACAYIVNDWVAWGQARDQLHLSVFSAMVIADADEQDEADLEPRELRRIPTLYPGEHQLPSGDGEPPPSQPVLDDSMLPDLPAKSHADQAEREALEARGQLRIDSEQPDPWANQRAALAAADERGEPRRIGNMIVTPRRGRRKE